MDSSTFPDSSAVNAQLLQMADRIMLGVYAPAAVVIDRDLHVQQFRGRSDLFLEHTPGPETLNLLQLVRPSLVPDLRSTIQRTIKTEKNACKERDRTKI